MRASIDLSVAGLQILTLRGAESVQVPVPRDTVYAKVLVSESAEDDRIIGALGLSEWREVARLATDSKTIRVEAAPDQLELTLDDSRRWVVAVGLTAPNRDFDVGIMYLALCMSLDDVIASPSSPHMVMRHRFTPTHGFIVLSRPCLDAYAARVGPVLLERFTSTEEGNELMQKGCIVPVLGIRPQAYRLIFVRTDSPVVLLRCDRAEALFGPIVARGGPYPLEGAGGPLAVVDAAALDDWSRSSETCFDLPFTGSQPIMSVAVTCHAMGPVGVGLPTFAFWLSEVTIEQAAPPLINTDPALLYEAEVGDEMDWTEAAGSIPS